MHLRGVATPMISANKPYHHHHKYLVFQNIKSYNLYLIKCNILVLLFKYLNNTFFKSL